MAWNRRISTALRKHNIGHKSGGSAKDAGLNFATVYVTDERRIYCASEEVAVNAGKALAEHGINFYVDKADGTVLVVVGTTDFDPTRKGSGTRPVNGKYKRGGI